MPAKKQSKKASKASKKKTSKKAPTPKVLLVNIIPKSLSGETHQDSEPTIAVNPANLQQIVATAFTPDPQHGEYAPIYMSQDGGNTWTLSSIVPGNNRRTGTDVASAGATIIAGHDRV